MNGAKKNNIERLRVIATLAVVMIHICMTEVNNSTLNSIGTVNYIIYSIGYDLVRWAVPVFIMITGYLLLNPQKELPDKKLFHYILRMAVTLLIFGTVYAAIEIVYTSGLGQWYLILPQALLKVVEMGSWDHLWYLYCLIGLYIITPLIKAATKSIQEKQLLILLCVLFVLVFLIPAVNMITGKKFSTFYISANQYLFYYLMGYYLSMENNRLLKYRKLVYAAGIMALITMSVWDSVKIVQFGDYSHWIRKANFLIPPMAVAIFVLFLSVKKLNAPTGKILKSISRCSFGIYLVHPFFINILYRAFHIAPTSIPIVLGIILLFLGVFAVSWLTAWILTKLPGFKRII